MQHFLNPATASSFFQMYGLLGALAAKNHFSALVFTRVRYDQRDRIGYFFLRQCAIVSENRVECGENPKVLTG